MDILDRFNKNVYFDVADEVIVVPDLKDVKINDAEVYMKRLADIQSPRERLIELFKSQFAMSTETTHEAYYIRGMGISGLAFGWLLGGITRSQHIFEDFKRQHNASVFDGNYRARRFFFNNYLYTTIRRGAKPGIGACLFCSCAGLIGFGSITYRNKLYLPDWLIGFGTLGALSRCFLGVRGVVFGTGMGILAGFLGYGYARLTELGSGMSVAQLRYLNHLEYLQKRQIRMDRIHRVRVETDQEKLSNVT